MSEYFSHDYNARNDLNMKKLFMGEGLAGIGLYWCIVEMLYEKGGYIELDYIPIIAFDLRTTEEVVHNVIEKYGLFTSNETHFYSNGVLNRLNLRAEKSEKARKSIEARWKKAKSNNGENTNEIRTYNDSITIKEKESKEKESKENIEINSEAVEIFNYWNDQKIIQHRELNDTVEKAILKSIKKYGKENVKEYIRRYSEVVNDKEYYFDYKWSLKDFLNRQGGISDFLDDGSKWVNYQNRNKSQSTHILNKNNVESRKNKEYEDYMNQLSQIKPD